MIKSRYINPTIGLVLVLAFAYLFIGFLIPRSPYTHANLSASGYDRTDIIYVGQEHPYAGFPLSDTALAETGDPVQDGRILFVAYGCAACHGLNGQGGATGKDLGKSSDEEVLEEVRRGPKTMPVYDIGFLPDSTVEKLIAFLDSIKE